MTAWVALLRAVNVGGRKLLMEDLRRHAAELGLAGARTFIASGNLLFTSGKGEPALKAMLEERLGAHMGATVGVMLRSAREMAEATAANPFADHPGNRVAAIFLDAAPPPDTIDQARNLTDESIALGRREIYVHYPSGVGQSKLRILAAAAGTGRNMNTVAKLAELAEEME